MNLRRIIFLFPGQSSRAPDMISRHAGDPEGRAVVAEASDVLGQDVAALFDPARPDLFHTNLDIQVGVFLSNEIHRRRLRARGARAVASLGLSLGEYNHLVEINAITFGEALRLVAARGAVYDAGPAGMMVSLYPTTRPVVEAILKRVRDLGRVHISNENSPKQFVIAGERAAVERVAEIFEEEEYAAPVTIEQRIPMHSPVFEPASHALRPHLEAALWQTPTAAYLPNVTATPILTPTPDQIVHALTQHVFKPVLWRQSIEAVLRSHPEAVFVEVGARRILCNLLSKKWVKAPRFASDDLDPDALVAALAQTELATDEA